MHTWSYNDAQSNGVVREIACDKIFGANLIANGDNKVKFEYDYYANADDYLADKNADKATHKSHKVQECDVKQKEDGTPYIEYSYINPGGEVAANYVEKTVTVDLPCYSTTRFVKDSDGNDCVPDINNYYSWGFIAASSDDRTYFVGGKSTDLRFTCLRLYHIQDIIRIRFQLFIFIILLYPCDYICCTCCPSGLYQFFTFYLCWHFRRRGSITWLDPVPDILCIF